MLLLQNKAWRDKGHLFLTRNCLPSRYFSLGLLERRLDLAQPEKKSGSHSGYPGRAKEAESRLEQHTRRLAAEVVVAVACSPVVSDPATPWTVYARLHGAFQARILGVGLHFLLRGSSRIRGIKPGSPAG